MDRSKIYEVYGSDPGVMTRALLEAVRPEQEIPPGGLVVLKPNLAVSKPAESGATTHPGIVGETIRYLREKGIDRMVILESSWIGDQPGKRSGCAVMKQWHNFMGCRWWM